MILIWIGIGEILNNFKRLRNFFGKNSLQQIVKGVTRPLATGGTCIDWLITNSKFLSLSGVTCDLISDHLPIFAIKKKCRNTQLKKRVLARSYKQFNKENFIELLVNKSWVDYFEITDPNELWDIMLHNITEILSIMCPLKCKNVFVNKPEWLTNEVLSLMNERNHYVKLAKERGALLYFQLSRFLRNKCNKLVNAAKGNFIRNKLHENRKNPKRFWRQINSLLSSEREINSNQQLIDPDTENLCIPGTESELINTHYATVGAKILENHVGDEAWDFGTTRLHLEEGLSFDELGTPEVEFTLSSIEIGKSSGLENISSMILKIAFTCLLTKLTHLFNCSLRTGIFPLSWAHGT